MSLFEEKYKDLLRHVMIEGVDKPSRGGTSTKSCFSQSISHSLLQGFPMLTGKKMYFKNIINEAKWLLSGDTNVKFLNDNGVKIWNNWSDDKGDLGPVYGHQIRNFNNEVDQLKEVVEGIKNNPHGRRHLISMWNPQQLSEMALPPCHYAFQFYVQGEYLNIDVQMRSGDLFVGIPYDMGIYSMILIMVAHEVGLKPYQVNINITDCHVYVEHLQKAVEYLKRPTHSLPTWTYIGDLSNRDSQIANLSEYTSESFMKVPINI
jgi:thymidylate synthase